MAVVFMAIFSVWYQKTQRVIDLLEDIKDNTRVPALGKKEEAAVLGAPERGPEEGPRVRSLLNSSRAEQIVGLLVVAIVLLVLYLFNQARFDSFFEGIF